MIQTISLDRGCYGRSVRVVMGDESDYFALISGLNTAEFISNSSYQRLFSDAEVVAKEMAWSACMRGAGFDYTHFLEPANQAWDAPRPNPDESRTAQADLGCRSAAGLTSEQLVDAETRLQQNDPALAGIDFLAFTAAVNAW